MVADPGSSAYVVQAVAFEEVAVTAVIGTDCNARSS